MCGIVGYMAIRSGVSISKKEISEMTNSMSHRGPDDMGHVLLEKGDLALGHRRLSILDLSERGHQPMSEADEKVWMSYNGEVYNYLELKKELMELGHVFHSTSDTEVVIKSYLQWGTECFKKFNGMWGLAIYDARSNRLILSRDRFGKKPLYYYQDDSVFIFASEIKAILRHPRVKREINPAKLAAYAGRHYRYVDNDEESFFKNIYQVPKSSFLVIDRKGNISKETYWSLTPSSFASSTWSEDKIVSEFREILLDAVRIRLRSDVPVGLMLSGGLDSTSIACLAAKESKSITAFSGVTGDGGAYDESEYMKEVVKATGIKSEFIYPRPEPLLKTLEEMLQFHDEPVCTVTWYSLYLMFKAVAEKGIKVVLTGHGGDELLAGYWDHYHYNFADIRTSNGDDSSEKNAWLANHGRPEQEYFQEKEFIERLNRNPSVALEKFSKYEEALAPDLKKKLKTVPNVNIPFKGSLSKRLYLELFYEAVPTSLRAEDRNTMSHSTENRVPFLDYRLAEFCFSLGNQFKIRNGLGKWLLRESMKGILPEKVRTRKDKVGFNAPADQWFRNEIRQDIEQMIETKSFINGSVYDPAVVRRYFSEHVKGANHAMFFWQYINVFMWYRRNFE